MRKIKKSIYQGVIIGLFIVLAILIRPEVASTAPPLAQNADMVDGYHALAQPLINTLLALDENAKFPNSVLYSGTGNGLDADLLDGLHASSFMQQGQVDSVTTSMLLDGSVTDTKLADYSVTTDKIANNAVEPSRIQSWTDAIEYVFPTQTPSTNNIIDSGIVVNVPAGKAYYYLVLYKGQFTYYYSERTGSSTGYYANVDGALLANTTEVGRLSDLINTGYRQDWSATGGNFYWITTYDDSWLVRLEEGTHNLKVRLDFYTDNSMNYAHIRNQSMQVMRMY